MGWGGAARDGCRGVAAGWLVFCLALVMAGAAGAAESREIPRLDRFSVIGFGVDFLERLTEEGTCRDLEESLAGAGTQGVVDVLGMAGVIGGALIGQDITGNAFGAVAGGVAGGYLASRQGRGIAEAAEARVRSESDQFAFEMCGLIVAADVLKRPMLDRYIQIAEEECAIDPALIPRMENRDWNMLVDCNNGRSEEARQITLQLIRINQATCFAIDSLGRRLTGMARDRGAPTADVGADPPECDTRSPAAVWQSYLSDRM